MSSAIYLCIYEFCSFSSLFVTSPNHSSFSNSSLALPTSQLILQPLRCFTYVTAHSPTLLSPLLRHRIFTYVTWRATHVWYCQFHSWNFTESWGTKMHKYCLYCVFISFLIDYSFYLVLADIVYVPHTLTSLNDA